MERTSPWFLRSENAWSGGKHYQDRSTMDVVGENEALQQFFEGKQSVSNMQFLLLRNGSAHSHGFTLLEFT